MNLPVGRPQAHSCKTLLYRSLYNSTNNMRNNVKACYNWKQNENEDLN